MDAAEAADAGADQHAGLDLVLIGFRRPVGVGERLGRGGDAEDDEIVDLALLLGLHPLVGVEGVLVGFLPARSGNLHGHLRGEVRYLEALDPPGAAFSRQQASPALLNAAGKRRHHAQSGYDDPAHCSPRNSLSIRSGQMIAMNAAVKPSPNAFRARAAQSRRARAALLRPWNPKAFSKKRLGLPVPLPCEA